MPRDASPETFDLAGLPVFNQDLEREPNPRVDEFKLRIRAADAILIATPEYKYSMPGVLKNAIGCASRPPGDSAWTGKPAAIIGASVGALGTARAQYHLRQCMVFLNMHPLNRPEAMLREASECFDTSGRLTDERSRKQIGELMAELVAWTRRLARPSSTPPCRA